MGTAVLCGAAIIAGDLVFRTSLLTHVRPIILTPPEHAVLTAPVQLRWEGPESMRVLLAVAGEPVRDLGVQTSPFELGTEHFPRDGGYQVAVQAERFASWVRAERWFQVHSAAPEAPAPSTAARSGNSLDLLRALEVARAARDRAQGRTKFLHQENAALRNESQRLARQLEDLYEAQEEDAERTAEIEQRLAQIAEENRALAEENSQLRLRLGSVIPCTVWGYYSNVRPAEHPLVRRSLLVSDPRGQIFRIQPECERVRRADPYAASICFCVGNSWGG